MALNDTISKDLETRIDIRSSKHGPRKTDPEVEMEKLESEMKEMAQKILHQRAALWDQFNTTLVSVLTAQRPVFLIGSDPAMYAVSNPDAGQVASSEEESLARIWLLKEKVSSNTSHIPIVSKRMRECILKIDKLDSQNINIHPIFKRKKTS